MKASKIVRHELILGLSLWLTACGLLGVKPALEHASDPTSTNFVIIFADDLGYGDVGAFGASKINTPHIDRLAQEGAKLDSFYAAAPVCSASRAGLLTGRYAIRSGIHGTFWPESFTGLPPDEVTIAEVLKEYGYATAAIGKWHLGHRQDFLPGNQGFDEFYGFPYSNDMPSPVLMRNDQVVEFNPDQRYLTRKYTHEALDFIERHQQQPFFLYLAHSMPHVPLYASEAFSAQSAGGVYGDVIEELDWSVGQIMARLEQLGLTENTLVIFTSDNGPWLSMGKYGGSSGPLRGGKHMTFEGGVRVPALAYWKGQIPSGLVHDDLVTAFDVLPTIARLAGAKLPDDRDYDGKDITEILLGQANETKAREFAYYERGALTAYRMGDWKLKLPHQGLYQRFDDLGWPGGHGPHDTLLFNLRDDMGETQNLAWQYPEKVAELQAAREAFQLRLGELPPALVTRIRADRTAQKYRDRHLKRLKDQQN